MAGLVGLTLIRTPGETIAAAHEITAPVCVAGHGNQAQAKSKPKLCFKYENCAMLGNLPCSMH